MVEGVSRRRRQQSGRQQNPNCNKLPHGWLLILLRGSKNTRANIIQIATALDKQISQSACLAYKIVMQASCLRPRPLVAALELVSTDAAFVVAEHNLVLGAVGSSAKVGEFFLRETLARVVSCWQFGRCEIMFSWQVIKL
jgi:hypothetical protein